MSTCTALQLSLLSVAATNLCVLHQSNQVLVETLLPLTQLASAKRNTVTTYNDLRSKRAILAAIVQSGEIRSKESRDGVDDQ